ncbi:MAG: tetratricopeptide repeat protein [bacterium]|nr:tetratricopeptide repeat protein [bacterium]
MTVNCGDKSVEEPHPEVISLLDRPLYSDPGGDSLLTAIDSEIESDPDNAVLLHRKGLALEGLRRFNEAIELYSMCIAMEPGSSLYLRRRGHRYINIREFEKSAADLEKAASIHTFEKLDHLSYTENLNWAIWYYLGLAYYLQGDFDKALQPFQNSYKYSADNVSLLASTNWVHITMRRLNRVEEAKRILEPINENMGFTGNYYKNILVYKGIKTESETFNLEEAELFELGTVGYGMGIWRLVNGDREGAFRIFRKIVEGESWHANGFMAAEAELARSK